MPLNREHAEHDDSAVTFVTHNGEMQADEIFSAVVIEEVEGPLNIRRTRDPRAFDTSSFRGKTFVVDVGGRFDGFRSFDHHQPGGAGKRSNGAPFASIGLIWQKFHDRFIRSVLRGRPFSDDTVRIIATNIDRDLIQGIDSFDSGLINLGISTLKGHPEQEVNIHHICASFHFLNGVPGMTDFDDESQMKRFRFAMSLARQMLFHLVQTEYAALCLRPLVHEANDGSSILVLRDPRAGKSWMKTVDALSHVEFVVSPGATGNVHVTAVRVRENSFDVRKPLPYEWAGLEGAEFSDVAGIPDGVFCTRTLALCGARSWRSAIRLAEIAASN